MNYKNGISLLVLIFLIIANFSVSSQDMKEANQKKFKETIAWLESKLAYDYYNEKSDVHWSNRFFYNEKTKTVSFRSVSTNSPKTAIKKKVLDRTVRLDHLNGATITLKTETENRGRIVKGTSIKVVTIGNEREIQRSFNGSTSLKESMVEIPVPKLYEDSLQDLSNSIRENLSLAIDLGSLVYPSQDTLKDVNIILDVFDGQFKGSNGATRTYNGILHTAIEADEEIGKTFVEKEIIGYDEKNHSFFRWTIHEHDTEIMKLKMDAIDKLSLFSEDGKYKLTVHGMHKFTIVKNGVSVDYHRMTF
ncbi:MAG: hypothetical protein JXR07_15705 [Reichenbachiella sp.]